MSTFTSFPQGFMQVWDLWKPGGVAPSSTFRSPA
jgi:hypothetical protein